MHDSLDAIIGSQSQAMISDKRICDIRMRTRQGGMPAPVAADHTSEVFERLAALGLTQNDLATAIGLEPVKLSKVKSGVRQFRGNELVHALQWLGARETDRERGIAPVRPDLPVARVSDAEEGAVAIKRVDLSYAMGDGTDLADYPEEEDVFYDAGFLRRITRAPAHRLFVARGDGDSMFPTLINDDEVVIDTTQRVLNMQDRIWACAFRGAGMIKRLRIVGEQLVEIRSDNTTVPPQTVSAEDLHIVGRVIWVGRRV
jgi:phage repressor protein C with HTH and peptisase S24 domain